MALAAAQQIPYSTHDWTVSVPGNPAFVEAWADVKTPGDGRHYAVGTITVSSTLPGSLFSSEPISSASGLTFNLPSPAQRQVVVVQVTDANQTILQQRYVYGFTSGDGTRATNARSISVWPAVDPADTRIAICGETYDRTLPLSQASPSAAVATAINPTGFFAVFDGNLELLWSHHVFGQMLERPCAITDLSVRVEGSGENALDVVTYCGISTVDVVSPNTPLTPVLPFAAAGGASGGGTQQATGFTQWDGIVGRVSRATATGTQTINFHSMVSGPGQDGMLGLAEMSRDRFVVVGGTALASGTAPSGFAFPGVVGATSPYYVAPVLVFNAARTRIGLPLVLENVRVDGTGGEGLFTLARDVVAQPDWFPNLVTVGGSTVAISPALHLVAVAGSTNDPAALSAQNTFQGGTDGYVSTFWDDVRVPTAPLLARWAGRFVGGTGDDGLTGIQGWNEYADQVVSVGFTKPVGSSTFDIAVDSYFINIVGPSPAESIRSGTIGGSGDDRPAVMGAIRATASGSGFVFNTGPLGDPAGGGVAVDERARVNVVGQTLSTDFTVVNGRPFEGGADAVRTVLDMLPPGVGRTDGTGDQGAFVLPSGFSGGTSPACALSSFGKQIDQPAPAVPRMLIEYRGPQPAATVAGVSIVVSRPTAPILPGAWASSVVLAGFQFGFPGVAVAPVLLPNGLELYTTDNPNIYIAGFGFPNQAHIESLFPLPTPPLVGQPMTVQMFFYIPSFVPGGIGPAPCSSTSDFTATPAMWMSL